VRAIVQSPSRMAEEICTVSSEASTTKKRSTKRRINVLKNVLKKRGWQCFRVELTGTKKEAEASCFNARYKSRANKNATLLSGVFVNAWSGKRDSHLASDPLKSKGFVISPQWDMDSFFDLFGGHVKNEKNISPSRATECFLQPRGEAAIRP
jgi:hypothetical protein